MQSMNSCIKKPLGVVIISILIFISSVITFGTVATRLLMPNKFSSSNAAWTAMILMTVIAVIFAWVSIELLRLKNWARITILCGAILIFLSMINTLLQQRIFPDLKSWWHFYIYPIIIIYLLMPSVRSCFKKK